MYTFVAHYVYVVHVSIALSVAKHSLLVTANWNHLKPSNPWKPNNSSRFPMFIPWTMATSTSSSLVHTCTTPSSPNKSLIPAEESKAQDPGILEEKGPGDVCYTPETYQDQRVDDILISRSTDLCEWSARPRFPWISHGRTLATWKRQISLPLRAKRNARSSNFTWTSPYVSLCAWYIWYIYCDTTWNLFKSGRKIPLDTGDLFRVQLTRIHGRWETQRER